MLKELYIKNYALIDELTVPFSEKLTVLTGETGAGKSIIIGALGLILGEKARTSNIRSGKDTCVVEGRIEVPAGHPIHSILLQKGIEGEEGTGIVVRRIITRSGTSKCFVNGLQVAVKDLQEITGALFDIHGQHEHQSLLNVKNHLFLLDQYGKLHQDLEAYRSRFRKIEELKKQIEEHTMDEKQKQRRMDILEYSINEIEQAELKEGEDEELEKEYRVLKNYEQLHSAVSGAYDSLKLNEYSALAMLESAIYGLSRARDYAEEIDRLVGELENARPVIEDIAYSLKHYIDGIEYQPGKIDKIQSRIVQIKGLKKKYGDSISEILEYKDRCQQELMSLQTNEETIRSLNQKLDQEIMEAKKLAVELSARRRVCAHAMEESVMKELYYLSMDKARFKVNIWYHQNDQGEVEVDGKRYRLHPHGLDSIEFLISANKGEPLLPLKGVASGGELSRIMLAIKTVLGNADPVLSFVFDEIDSGIGGKVAWAVGNRLRELSRLKQTLCVTHQAQIASRGDMNIRVEKLSRDNRSITSVKVLSKDEKVSEVARMISGKSVSEPALKQAHEMIKEE
ncbi:MAG: DNA repair protein RecN [Spirochaetota bacterium]